MADRFAEYIEKRRLLSEEGVALREAIKSGGDSLGSKLGDFVLSHYGFDSRVMDNYKRLQNRLRESGGQEGLIFHENRAPYNMLNHSSCSGIDASRGICEVNLDLYFGVLSGKGLDFDMSEGEVIFPTGRKHVSINSQYLDVGGVSFAESLPEVHNRRPRVSAGNLPHLSSVTDLTSVVSAMGYGSSSGIFIGEDVVDYLSKAVNGHTVCLAARDLLEISNA